MATMDDFFNKVQRKHPTILDDLREIFKNSQSDSPQRSITLSQIRGKYSQNFFARQKHLIFNCHCSCIQSTNWRGFSRQGKHANPNVFCPDNPLYRLLYQSNWHIAIFHLRGESGIREHTKTSSSLTRAISVYLFIMQYIFNTVLLII